MFLFALLCWALYEPTRVINISSCLQRWFILLIVFHGVLPAKLWNTPIAFKLLKCFFIQQNFGFVVWWLLLTSSMLRTNYCWLFWNLTPLGMYKEPLKNMINASERRISEPATYQQYQINDWSTYPPKKPRWETRVLIWSYEGETIY